MILNVNDVFRIKVADGRNYTVELLRPADPNHHWAKKNSQPRWVALGHYGRLSQALESLLDRHIHYILKGDVSMDGAGAAVERLRADVGELLGDIRGAVEAVGEGGEQ